MIKLQTFPYHQFPEVFKWQVLSFMKVEWPFIFSGQYQFNEDTYPPEQNPIHFVISKDNALISHAEVITIKLVHMNEEYLVYGFGNVFTFPPYRGNGHGQDVVAAGTNYIMSGEVDVAILFCDPNLVSFYEKAGWAALPNARTRIGTAKDSNEHDGLRMMQFLSEKGKSGYSSFVNETLYIEDPW